MSSCRNLSCPGAHGEGGTKTDPDHVVIHSHARRSGRVQVRPLYGVENSRGELVKVFNTFDEAIAYATMGKSYDANPRLVSDCGLTAAESAAIKEAGLS